jgi:hypothetical protein
LTDHLEITWMLIPRDPIAFLVDVDSTLLDNDGIQQDLRDQIEQVFGRADRDRYWRILEGRFAELGYRDYIGAPQRYRVEHPREVELLPMSSFLIDYPFAERLYPKALDVLKRLKSFGPTPILSPHQGTYADDPEVVRDFPPVDVTIEHIGNLLDYDLPRLLRASPVPA